MNPQTTKKPPYLRRLLLYEVRKMGKLIISIPSTENQTGCFVVDNMIDQSKWTNKWI